MSSFLKRKKYHRFSHYSWIFDYFTCWISEFQGSLKKFYFGVQGIFLNFLLCKWVHVFGIKFVVQYYTLRLKNEKEEMTIGSGKMYEVIRKTAPVMTFLLHLGCLQGSCKELSCELKNIGSKIIYQYI